MIATSTHENFAALARPQQQVQVNLYIYIHIHIHTHIYIRTHTHTQREACKSIIHSRYFSAITTKYLQLPRKRPSLNLRDYSGKSMLLHICIYIYTQTYIYTHNPKETGQHVHLPRTAPCRHLRRKNFYYHAQDIRCTWRPQRQVHVTFIYIHIRRNTHIYIYRNTQTHTETGQQVNLPSTASCLQLRRNHCKNAHENFAAYARPQRQYHIIFNYI
jgi:hypothetical protein